MIMPKDIKEIQSEIIYEDEVGPISQKAKKPMVVAELAKRFIDPKTNEPIKVGQAVDFGPYDTEGEGTTWLNYYLPEAKRDHLKWGKQKSAGGHTLPTTIYETKKKMVQVPGENGDKPHQIEKVFIRVIRIRE
jgi:hypothetical protein